MNARFVTQPLTGVQRYCYEVALNLESARLFAPRSARREYHGLESRVAVAGQHVRGHSWEQLVLPLLIPKGHALFSPAGCGPLCHANQVITIHDLAPLENPEWYSRPFALWYSLFLPALSARVRKIVTVSDFCKARIMERLRIDEKKITVASEAAGPTFYPRPKTESAKVLERFGIRAPYFLFVGAVSGRKNLPRLLEAWNRVEAQVGGIRLIIIAREGLRFSDKPGLKTLPASVSRLVAVDDDDLACFYSSARGLLYPSLYEGFGLPIVEAMACGCPVLTSNRTAMPEVASDAAVIIEPLDVGSIAQGILELADPSRASELRAKGFAQCRKFSWKHTSEIVETALLE